MKNKRLYKLGWLSIILSCLCWVVILVIPFLNLSAGAKAAGITGSIVLGEVFFWIGALFVGKEVAGKFKSYLNPKNWRKKERD
ncbi:transporter suffix domain-containing protein [Peribacillus sp. SCS-155]|uniref:transporter suffix domain-containing protein n=1 Tax=Peribacillus sedimenti TaxID=3115297 RepID=UPI00390602C1